MEPCAAAEAAASAGLPCAPRVLLIVDMLNPLRFDGAAALAKPALRAATVIAQLKRRLAQQGVPALYANDQSGPWRADFDAVVARCRASGGTAAAMARRLAPGPQDLTLLKPRHSAFYATPLSLLLEQMGTRELVLTGVSADLCLMFTAMDAYERGYRLWIPADCTATESPQRTDTALQWMVRSLGVDIAPAGRGTRIAKTAQTTNPLET